VNGKWLIRSARDIPIEEEAAAPAIETPPLEELAWLVGKWQAKSEKHTITLDCDWQLDKSFLVQKFHVTDKDGDFDVVTWIAFDPSEGRFRQWFFDSRGGFGGGAWSQRENEWRIGTLAVLPDGQIGSSINTWEAKDKNTAIWRAIEREVDGEALPDAEQTYVRVAGTTAAAPGKAGATTK
jgi:hypothetical protein